MRMLEKYGPDLLQLDQNSLQLMLPDDNLIVACEETVFKPLLRWTRYDEHDREAQFVELLNLVVRVKEIKPKVRLLTANK